MLSYQIIVVSIVIIFIIVALYKELLGAGFIFLIGVTVLGLFKILTPSEILSGFANEQIVVIIMLLLLGDIFRETSLLDIFFDKIFKSTKTYPSFISKMLIYISPVSAFLNNTPLVAIMLPYTHSWAKRNNAPISKLLIPLSYATILGGCATLIGTSTNLIVNGLVLDQKIIENLEPLKLFDFAYVGIPMMIIGFFYVRFFGHKLLPDKQNVTDTFVTNSRKYIVEVVIKNKSQLIGTTLGISKIKSFEGLSLFQIIRDGNILESPSYDTILEKNDVLLFAGNTDAIADLIDEESIVIPSLGMFSRKKNTDIVEIVISHNSSMINKSLESENFRAKYDATTIAIHRNGEMISGKIGSVDLKGGDAILLLASKEFDTLANLTNDFYIINKVKEISRLGVLRSTVLIGGSILTILLSTLGIIKLFFGLIVLLSIVLILKISKPNKLAKSIDFDLALIIAMSLALGIAMEKTGFAEIIAAFLINIFKPLGSIGLLSGIYLITALLAAFITNKAAVALVFPVALTMAKELDLPPLPFILVVSFAAAANFMTPTGYQTNTMVYGPGGYKFKDYLRIGTPLTIIYGIVTIIILSFMYII